MSDHELERDPPDDDLLAGEFVLGVLDDAQRRQLQARVEADPVFAGLVAAWEQRFVAFFARVAPVPVPAHVWPRLRTHLGWAPVEDARPGLWQNPRFWRGTTVAAMAMAAALAVVTFVRPMLAPPTPTAPPVATVPPPVQPPAPVEEEVAKPVVVLARDDGATGWLAAVDARRGAVTMVPVPAPADPQGRVGELWLIPAGGAPLSLGFVSGEKAHTIEIPDALRDQLVVGATLAITLEPEAGIPHAAPTGPVVAAGSIQTI